MAPAPGFPGFQEPGLDSGLDGSLDGSLDLGAFDWELDSGEVFWDAATLRILGCTPDSAPRRIDDLRALILPDDRPLVEDALRHALKRGETDERAAAYEVDYRVTRGDDVRWISALGRVVYAGGQPVRVVGVVRDATTRQTAQRLISRTLEQLPDAFVLLTSQGVITYLNPPAAVLLRVPREEGVGRSLWSVAQGLADRGAIEPVKRAVEGGDATTVQLYAPAAEKWFDVQVLPSPSGAALLARESPSPAAAGGGTGVGTAAERSRAVDLAREVFTYSTALSQADDVAAVSDVVATMVLPTFGAAGMIVALAESGRMRIRGHAGYHAEVVESLDGQSLESHTPIAEAMRSATPLFVPHVGAYLAAWPLMAKVVRESDKRAWAFLPLLVGNEAIGSLTISFHEARVLTPDERSLMVSLAAQLAQTLARVRLRAAEHELAATLQQGLLPQRLPQTQGVRVAARYLPATRGVEVGGDWYDVVPLPTGGVALVIGDVQGHSVAAAATMGQLRNALRAYASEGHDPITVLSRTNRLMAELAPDTFATCCYVLVDVVSERLTIVSAGHPAPLVRRADGTIDQLPVLTGAPLGVNPDEVYRAATAFAGRGDLLLLFTDGLVEDSATPMDDGIAAVSAVLSRLGDQDLDACADAVTDHSLGAEHRGDDVAVLLARLTGLAEADRPMTASRSFDAQVPGVVAECRAFVRRRLETWPLPPDSDSIVATAVLLTSELVTNAIRYAPGPLELAVRLVRGRIRVQVRDELPAIPAPRRPGAFAETGRGLHIVEELSSRWGTIPHGHGKTVWFELDLGVEP